MKITLMYLLFIKNVITQLDIIKGLRDIIGDTVIYQQYCEYLISEKS